MGTAKRLYQRTHTGERAMRCNDRSLTPAHRRVLARIDAVSHSDHLPEKAALEALERQGLVESVAVDWLLELYRLGCHEPTSLHTR